MQVLRPAEAARPEVRLEDWDGLLVVVKDYRVNATPVKLSVGKYLVARETAAHKRLAGLEGISEAVETGNPYVFASHYVEGWPAPEVPDRLTPAFFEQLYGLVAAIHSRGMAHGDLKRLQNILVRPDGRPAVVDFGAAIMSGSNPLVALVLGYIQDDDLRAVAKLKQRHAPHLLTDTERQLLAHRPLAERVWRWLRAYLRPQLQRLSDAGEANRIGLGA
ncbi:MAG: hypothetical protein N2512_12130 [Armatimonadetes bacterium]|nr:hypothetical protein [Armatimonadota bacterium]